MHYLFVLVLLPSLLFSQSPGYHSVVHSASKSLSSSLPNERSFYAVCKWGSINDYFAVCACVNNDCNCVNTSYPLAKVDMNNSIVSVVSSGAGINVMDVRLGEDYWYCVGGDNITVTCDMNLSCSGQEGGSININSTSVQCIAGESSRSCDSNEPYCHVWSDSYIITSGSVFCRFQFDVSDDLAPPCSNDQIATVDSAYYTGTHANPPRYEFFQLPSSCPKTVIPLSTLPNSSFPAIDNNNQLNVAVSLDQNGNFVSEGWSNNYTQAIFVSAEQTREQLGCESDDPDGYFVFCSSINPGSPPPTHTVCAAEPCPNPDPDPDFVFGSSSSRPPDTTTTFVPPGGGGGGSSSSGGGTDNLSTWQEMWERTLRAVQSVPNPLPILGRIYDKLVEFKDFVVDLFEPQEDPELPDLDYELDDWKLDSLDNDLDTNFVLDTIPEIDTKWLDSLFPDKDIKKELDSLKEIEDSLVEKEGDDIIDKYKKKLDSLKPDTAKVADKTKEKVLETFKQMADEIKEAVAKGLKPIQSALPSGDGGCSCLQDSFKGFSVGIKKGSSVSVGGMGNTSLICDNIAVIRKIIMIIVAVSSIGMILATLRR